MREGLGWGCALASILFVWTQAAVAAEGDAKTESKPQGAADVAAAPAPAPTNASKVEPGSEDASPLNPEANEFPGAPPAAAPVEFDRLLAEIAALRGRVAALMTSLFTSKLQVNVESLADEAHVVGLVVTLDGGVIYSSTSFGNGEPRQVYQHSVAPGHHVLGIQIERVDARAKEYRSWQQSRFSIVVPDKKQVEANFTVEDDSDMGEAFTSSEAGEYSLEVELYARVVD